MKPEHRHKHHHLDSEELSEVMERRLWWAVGANTLLTVAQVVGGLLSGSLSLIADALHNFSDAASLFIALIAIRIGRRPPDKYKSFGYRRVETIAALINLTSLALIGFYLVIEALKRFYTPEEVEGWTIVIVAGIALLVDVFTALLTYTGAKNSMNIKAAFLHNVTDALASVGVIVTGAIIIWYQWLWTDAAMTLIIAGYVLWQSFREMPKAIHLLMDGTPEDVSIDEVTRAIEELEGVESVHHVHIWQLDEQRNALEAHVVLKGDVDIDEVKKRVKRFLLSDFNIEHATLELERERCDD